MRKNPSAREARDPGGIIPLYPGGFVVIRREDLYDQSQAIPGRRRGFRNGNSVSAASYFFRHMKLRSRGEAHMSNAQPSAAFTPSDFSAVQMKEIARSIERTPTTHFDALIIGAGFSGMYNTCCIRYATSSA
ncbi:MAG: hypothetical protein ACRETH_05605 [Steroidobacteraceae bacterium]